MNEEKLYGFKSEKIPTKFDEIEEFLKKKYIITYNYILNEHQIALKRTPGEKHNLNFNSLLIELARYDIKVTDKTLLTYLNSSFITQTNPIKSYFENLPTWDGKDHIKELLLHVKSVDNSFMHYHIKKWLVRTVKCSIIPKYFNKNAIILYHNEQNSGKSTFCRSLCPPALNNYIAENPSADKDGLVFVSQTFLINLDETDKIPVRYLNFYKSLLSKDKINIRLPYDKKSSVRERCASFIGSANDVDFLIDKTGSIRWIIIELIDKIDFNYSNKIDINKVWSQAYHLAFNDESFDSELTNQDVMDIQSRNRELEPISAEEEFLTRYFNPSDNNDDFKTPTDIAKIAKSYNLHFKAVSIGKFLKKLKYERKKQKGIYGYLIKRKES